MTTRIITGDCRDVLRALPDASVQCCVSSFIADNTTVLWYSSGMKKDTRIQRGEHLSPATEFKTGQHWRPRKPHWDRMWLDEQYTNLGRSTGDIARDAGCTDAAILFWLSKYGIRRRSISEARALKKWGASGATNPMFGRRGATNPRYVDGSAPERQRLYVQSEGKAFLRAILKRDGYRCRRCNAPHTGGNRLHVHHVKPWAGNPDLRFDAANVATLCYSCHRWVHSKANVMREWLA